MKLLFVDDDRENVDALARVLRDAVPGSVIEVATTVEDAVVALHNGTHWELVVTDLFIPMGSRPGGVMGPRARKYAEDIEHLGGLVLLDEIDRVNPAPMVLAHTACTDPILIQLLGERVHARVRKPAPFEVLLNAIMDALRERDRAAQWG